MTRPYRTGANTVPDGVWLVDLSGVRDGRLIPAAAAAFLGLALTGARPTAAAVVKQLADRRMVVLLDNCEHLLGACAELTMALLPEVVGLPPGDLIEQVRFGPAMESCCGQHCVLELRVLPAAERALGQEPLA